MPLYTWEHKETKEVVEVVRPMSESDIPPTAEESGKSDDDSGNWQKIMQPVDFRRGDSWRGSKGNWGRS